MHARKYVLQCTQNKTIKDGDVKWLDHSDLAIVIPLTTTNEYFEYPPKFIWNCFILLVYILYKCR